MPKRTRNYRAIPEDWTAAAEAGRLPPELEKLAAKFPRLDLAGTFEIFADKALAAAWVYADWTAAFRNYCRNGDRYGGVAYRNGREDPAWSGLLREAEAVGFRKPGPHETPEGYRTALRQHRPAAARGGQGIIDFGAILKRAPGSK